MLLVYLFGISGSLDNNSTESLKAIDVSIITYMYGSTLKAGCPPDVSCQYLFILSSLRYIIYSS